MLDTHCKRKAEAEALYQRAIDIEPRHSYALYNLAVLLEEKLTRVEKSLRAGDAPENAEAQHALDRDIVLELYKRALEADPSDSTTAADYGR